MFGRSKEVQQRLKKLENHLQNESPLLVDAVNGYKELDLIAYRLGLLDRDQSNTSQIPWWPLISVLGTDTEGKTSFLNNYLDYELLDMENPEDEQKFTVISYARGNESRSLPAVALDADPRFPFYQMAGELEKATSGNDANINDCLQLKTCPSKQSKGYIFINSPGFPTKVKESSAAKITNRIIDISDLVLVFIDSEQAKSSKQQDVLEDLLSSKDAHKYASKFVFILNNNDSESDDNSEDGINKLCQKFLSEKKLSSAKILTLQQAENVESSKATDNGGILTEHYQGDTDEVISRIQQIYVDRTYRILGNLHNQARNLEQKTIPKMTSLMRKWERGVIWRDIFIFSVLLVIGLAISYTRGLIDFSKMDISLLATWFESISNNISMTIPIGIFAFMGLLFIHFGMRYFSKRSIFSDVEYVNHEEGAENLKSALSRNMRLYRSIFRPEVVGWNRFTRNRLRAIIKKVDLAIQKMNDQYTRPSGEE